MIPLLKLTVLLLTAQCTLSQFLSESNSDGADSGEVPGQGTPTKETSCRCGWTNSNQRIVGGKEAIPNEFPFMVAVGVQDGPVFCGGSILNEKLILSAAHCTVDKKNYTLVVYAGIHSLKKKTDENVQSIVVDYTIEHPDYTTVKPNKYRSDIAIMVLKSPLVFNQLVGPICLPTESTNLVNKIIRAMGWGTTNYNVKKGVDKLLKVNVNVVNMDDCNVYKKKGLYNNHDNQICTKRKRKDTCTGDSGGPLLWLDPETDKLTQVALVSYGIKCASSYPAVNTNLFFYVPWIEQTLTERNLDTNFCRKV